MARVTCAISAALICAKSFFCSTSLSETESRSSCSWACGVSVICGCAKRLLHPARGRRRLLLGVIRQRHRIQHVLPLLGGAEEQVEGLREDQSMLVALDEDRLQRGEDVGALADVDHLQRVHGIDDGAGTDRNPGRPQRAGKADDIVGHLAGRGREMIDGHRIAHSRHSGARKARTRNLAPQPLDFGFARFTRAPE